MDEIAKLEALYASNPDGRVFTHLAEAYRKSGQYERARTTLEQGLTKHPAYASAHVVLGRVFIDLNQPEEASESFRRVLQLDPHNLVALRSLGDLARAAGRNAEALGYFEELRHQDPSNEELEGIINDLLASPGPGVEAPQPSEPAAPPAEQASAPEPEPPAPWEPDPVAELPDFASAQPDFGEIVSPDVELDWATEPAEDENPLPGDLAGFASLNASAPAESTDTFGDVDLSQPPTDMPIDLGGFDVDLSETTPEVEAETPLDFGDFGMVSEPAPEPPMIPEAVLPEPEPEPETEPQPQPEPEPAPVAPPASPAPEGELVTETMAELYRSQGLNDRAADVYRALLRQRPDDAALQAKLAGLEAAPVTSQTEEEVESPWTSPGASSSSAPTPYAWTEDQGAEQESGPPVTEYFRTLLSWKPAQSSFAPAPEVEEQPTEMLDLGEPLETAEEPMFSDEPMPWEEPAAEAAAPPAAPTPSVAATPDDAFDEWFGTPEPVAPAPASTAPVATTASAADEPADQPAPEGEDDDDLEMFRSWLQSLKK